MYMKKDDVTYNLTKLKILSNKKNIIFLVGWIYFGLCLLAFVIGWNLSPLSYKGLSVSASDIIDIQNNNRNDFLFSLLPLAYIILRYWFVNRSYNKLENKIEKGS
ncbi:MULTISPECIES: hypothetical protein [Mammaliicoccus]|uniref:hypothetical protein n=2 Tax=Mammaliicoccus TaxID=2803850 RepID=UPI001952244E|nr:MULTISPECIES: hypothetical protein [Mammaliicoccus]